MRRTSCAPPVPLVARTDDRAARAPSVSAAPGADVTRDAAASAGEGLTPAAAGDDPFALGVGCLDRLELERHLVVDDADLNVEPRPGLDGPLRPGQPEAHFAVGPLREGTGVDGDPPAVVLGRLAVVWHLVGRAVVDDAGGLAAQH